MVGWSSTAERERCELESLLDHEGVVLAPFLTEKLQVLGTVEGGGEGGGAFNQTMKVKHSFDIAILSCKCSKRDKILQRDTLDSTPILALTL